MEIYGSSYPTIRLQTDLSVNETIVLPQYGVTPSYGSSDCCHTIFKEKRFVEIDKSGSEVRRAYPYLGLPERISNFLFRLEGTLEIMLFEEDSGIEQKIIDIFDWENFEDEKHVWLRPHFDADYYYKIHILNDFNFSYYQHYKQASVTIDFVSAGYRNRFGIIEEIAIGAARGSRRASRRTARIN
jgi:hypothetical protein